MKINNWLLLFVILILGIFLRLYKIDVLPISLSGDEIDAGYQSWSLATTAKDYTGHFLPTFLHSLSEMRTPLLPYFLAPFISIFGLSTLSLKVPVALLGVLNIYLIYFLANKLFSRNQSLGLLTSLILATSPWHIHFSRIAFDSTLLLSLYLIGTIFFISNKVYLSLIFFVLTFWTYPTANVFTPLIVGLLWLIYKQSLLFHKKITFYLISFLFFVPVIINLLTGYASGRFAGISIFSDQKTIDSIITTRTEPWVLGHKSEALYHNKFLVYLKTFTSQYLNSFSPEFLFISGDPNYRHSIGEFGELFTFLFPFLILGFIKIFIDWNKSESKLILGWLLLSPIASAFTQGGGTHATRLIIMLPALIIIISLGVITTHSWLKNNILRTLFRLLFAIILGFNLFSYWHRYSNHYRYLSFRNWQYGYENVLKNLPNISEGNKLFINNTYEPSLMKYLFYARISPSYFQKVFQNDQTIDNVYKDVSGYKFGDNVYFVSPSSKFDFSKLLDKGDVYVAAQGKEIPGDWDWSKTAPSGFSVISVSHDPYGNPLFTVLRKN